MKRNRMHTNLQRSIVRSLGRYIAIVAIIALGCSIFVGLRITKTDMVATGQDYVDEQNMFDLRLLSTYGWTQKQVDSIKQISGISDAEGSVYLDAYAHIGSGDDSIYRFYSVPERVNKVYLLSGRMPAAENECLVDGDYFPESAIGETITVSAGNEQGTLDSFIEKTYTVVGRISTPLYMDMTRGTTTLGSGSLATYVYIPQDALVVDYFTEVYVTLPGKKDIYSEAYNDRLDTVAEQLELILEPVAVDRYQDVLQRAEREYADGLAEYEKGLADYNQGKLDAENQFADALKQLEDAQAEIDAGWQALLDGESQIADAQKQIDEGLALLEASRLELENAKADAYSQMAEAYAELMENYKLVTQNLPQVTDGIAQIDDGIAQIDDGLSQIESSRPLLEVMVDLMQTQVDATAFALQLAQASGDENLTAQLQVRLEEQQAQLADYTAQLEMLSKTKIELETTRQQLINQRAELVTTKETLEEALQTIELGFTELETNENVAKNQFAAAEAQINAGLLELQAGQAELDAKKAELEQGRQDLLIGEAELKKGREDYEKGKLEAEAELTDAQIQLSDAERQLADARKTIDEMTLPDLFVLTRNTNAGYLALDSNSDIVSGIAKVLPVFFLLIAALVCITTMTRMVEEERTQIGTLKALGHSNMAIMGKYIWYSASAAIIGCTLGVIVGSTFFPNLLWNAYGIIFNIRPDVVLTVDWGLSIGITAAYLACSTLVTWYCCRRTLSEVPAQLIRPKAPESGKKILLERLPFWHKLSFLNKVMLRNVARYKQRMLMMIIGIGGCTALLLTGFGLRDTIVGLAQTQFEKVNHFDIQVIFSDGQTKEDQQYFLDQLRSEGIAGSAGFFYQTSAQLYSNDEARDIYLVAADSGIRDYMSFCWDEEQLPLPGKGEALISAGIAEIMEISVGDTVELRSADMDTMTVTVTGIYENHVYNYAIVSPESVTELWGTTADAQMAYLLMNGSVDVHEANAQISTMEGVVSTTVCEDSAEMFNSMMSALELVIASIIFSAGLLGAIVLYNLTNININERIREIATIKVLGFNAAETSSYVFKENILLTCMGVIFGIPLGRWFLDFVMEHIKIDMVWFKTSVNFWSFIFSVLLTLLCATIVDFIFHHKLDKINMAEALKSVE